MTDYQYDYLVLIGRFQPFHNGHELVIREALTLAKKVIIVIGSSFAPRTVKNPWSAAERIEVIRHVINDPRLKFVSVRDRIYNDTRWATNVQELVAGSIADDGWVAGPTKVGIIGYDKDETSYYLKMFPQWGDPINHEQIEILSATDLRQLYFEGKNLKFLKSLVPSETFDFLQRFRALPEFARLVEEYNTYERGHASWVGSPHKPIFVTTDAVVLQSGHILLVVRDQHPGEGLWALPGGFLEQHESIAEGVLRELDEETDIKVPPRMLQNMMKTAPIKVFDHPKRSLRGRTITHAALLELPPGPLPRVRGKSDARAAFWLPLNQLDSARMFEDHFDVIEYFL